MKDECKEEEHQWVEIERNERIQVLRCSVCGKHSTGKFTEDTQLPDDWND